MDLERVLYKKMTKDELIDKLIAYKNIECHDRAIAHLSLIHIQMCIRDSVIGPAASKNIEALPAVEDLFQQDVPFSSEIEYPDPLSEDPAPVEPISDPDSLTYPLSDVLDVYKRQYQASGSALQ